MPPPTQTYWGRIAENRRRIRRMLRRARRADPTYRPGMRLPEDDYEPLPRVPESAFDPPIVFQYPVSLMLLSPEARLERRLESDFEWNVRYEPDVPIGEVRPKTPPAGYDGTRFGMVRCRRCKSWCHPSDTEQGICFVCRGVEPCKVNREVNPSTSKENRRK